MMSLVLVYAGTPTIFANFRTFIRLYFTIFHSYIALLHCSSTLQSYLAVLPRTPTSHRTLHHIATYVASPPMSHRHLCRIATSVTLHPASHRIAPRSIASPLPRVTPRDMSGAQTISGR